MLLFKKGEKQGRRGLVTMSNSKPTDDKQASAQQDGAGKKKQEPKIEDKLVPINPLNVLW